MFLSQWDKDYYFLYGESGNFSKKVNGYNATVETPSFFGSKLVYLPDSLSLNAWDTTSVQRETDNAGNLVLTYNLSQAIFNIFSAKLEFINNWNGLPSEATDKINEYILDTVVNYYNLGKNKIKVRMHTKPFDGNKVHYALDPTFNRDDKMNIDGLLTYEKGQYLYKITVPGNEPLSYYFDFTVFEK